MKKNKIINKSVYSLLLLSLLLTNSIGTAQALFGSSVKIPSFEEIADKIEKRYGFDSNILRNSRQKGDYPQVEVFFDKTAPKEGEKVTATAMPKYFKNTGQQLYYTWFLFRDGDDDIEKAKQLAMGMVARGDFDPLLFKTNYSNGGDDPDKDGYEASFGGDNGVGGKKTSSGINQYEFNHYIAPISKQIVNSNSITRCYRHNFGFSQPSDYDSNIYPGEDLIVECEHKFPSNPVISFIDFHGNNINCEEGEFEVGDGELTTKEEACWRLDPLNSDTDGDGFLDEADLAGLGQTQLTWAFQQGDRVGVVIEGTSMVTINEGRDGSGVPVTSRNINLDGVLEGGLINEDLDAGVSFEATDEIVATDIKTETNPYYKITWAGLDICDKEEVEGDDKRNLIRNDECEGTADYGFSFLATKKVDQEAEEILKPTLISNTLKAQVDLENLKYSDYINIKAVFDNQTNIDPDFINYEWSVYIVDENGNPLPGTGELIATNLIEGEISQGLGVNNIKFRGTGSTFSNLVSSVDNIRFLIGLEVVGSKKSKRASIEIPITSNDVAIKLLDKNGDLVCDSNPYDKVCPVYPGQTLYAVYDGGAAGTITGFSWELEEKKLLDKKNYYSPIPATVSSSVSSIVVPITGSDMELQTISLKAQKDNGDEITSERLLSVSKPMAKIISNNANAWPVKINEGQPNEKESENVFGFNIGEQISLRADIVPNYLNNNLVSENVELKWYINNQEVTPGFINNNPLNNITVSGQDINFELFGTEGDSINLTLKLTKKYTDAEKNILKNAWGINISRDQIFEKSIVLKKDDGSGNVIVKGNSMSIFMASTLNNAPEYFVFIIKTAIVFVLFWSLLFGFNYWFNQEVKLKRLND